MSFQIGEDSYLNFYQNAGIKTGKATNAFELIASSGKLQNQFLGKKSPLSEESKSELFNGLNSRAVDGIARPIGEMMVEYGAGALVGGILGKTVGYIGKKMLAKAAVESGMRVGQNLTREAVVVMNNAGRIVSTYPASMFDNSILNVLK
ncbi:hypothetical protein [Bacteroides caecimuris]|uniref:hypothetical protein n=1 Tax=Bacteroides caecimuris TaxID=1796613 RepID=UPI00263B02EE|nr:hypothetical protein [Bacteroides caecimuris]